MKGYSCAFIGCVLLKDTCHAFCRFWERTDGLSGTEKTTRPSELVAILFYSILFSAIFYFYYFMSLMLHSTFFHLSFYLDLFLPAVSVLLYYYMHRITKGKFLYNNMETLHLHCNKDYSLINFWSQIHRDIKKTKVRSTRSYKWATAEEQVFHFSCLH